MNMQARANPQKGSVLLTVVLLMTALCFFCLLVWRTTSYNVDVVVDKICHEQMLQALYGLQEYAALFVHKNYDALTERMYDYQLIFQRWPLATSVYRGKINIIPQQGSLKIECCLERETILKMSTCCYAKDAANQHTPTVLAWQIIS